MEGEVEERINQLERELEAARGAEERAKAAHRKDTVNTEQIFHQLEVNFKQTEDELATANKKYAALSQKHAALVAEFSGLKVELESTHGTVMDRDVSTTRLRNELEQAMKEKTDLAALVASKARENDRLIGEIEAANTRLGDAIQAKGEAENRANDLESEKVAIEFVRVRLEREKQQLETHNTWLSDELNLKDQELLSVKKSTSERVYDCQAKLNEATAEITALKNALQNAQAKEENSALQHEEHLKQIKRLKDENTQMQEQFNKENASHKRLAELYLQRAEQSETLNKELEGALEALKPLADQANEETVKEKEELAKANADLTTKYKRMLQEVERLKYQLANVDIDGGPSGEPATFGTPTPGGKRQREEDDDDDPVRKKARREAAGGEEDGGEDNVALMSPTARAVRNLESSGKSLTDLYTELRTTKDELRKAQMENKRLTRYMGQIMTEIEQKGPVLAEQRKEYDRAIRAHGHLTTRLAEAMRELDELGEARTTLEDKLSSAEARSGTLERECQDLARQVQLLLKETTENSISGALQEEDHGLDLTDAASVISSKLVTFRNIQQLQERNQQLLSITRNLAAERERDQATKQEAMDKEVEDKLKSALEELENLQKARGQHQEVVTAVVRQRDMYRVLLAQADAQYNKLDPGGVSELGRTAKSSSQRSSHEGEDYPGMLAALREEHNLYRKEKDITESMLSEALEKAREEASDSTIKLARVKSQLEYEGERNQVLVGSVESLRSDLEMAQTKGIRMSTSLVDHQKKLEEATGEVALLTDKTRRMEMALENAKAEKELLKNAEARAVAENASLLKERNRLEGLITNLQAVHMASSSADSEGRRRTEGQLEDLRAEVKVARATLESERERAQQREILLEGRGVALENKNDKLMEETAALKVKLAEKSAATEGLAKANAQLQAQLRAAENKLNVVLNDRSGSGGKGLTREQQLEMEVANLRSESETLAEERAAQEQSVEEYAAVAKASEKALKEQYEISEQFKQRMTGAVQQLEAIVADGKKKITKLEDNLTKSLQDNNTLQEDITKLKRALDSATSAKKASDDKLRQTLESQEQRENAIRKDVALHSRLAKDAKANYERELMLHSEDVKTLTELKQQMRQTREEAAACRTQQAAAQQALEEGMASWTEQKTALMKQVSELEERTDELLRQNDVLHDQMESMSEQALKIKGAAEAAGAQEIPSPTKGDTSEQLREVIRFLRQEKEVLSCKYELSSQEAVRYRQKAENALRSLEEARSQLAAEREKLLMDTRTQTEHSKLLEQVQQLNLLRESNAMLRSENTRIVDAVKKGEQRVLELERKLKPLIEEKRALTAEKEAILAEKESLANENKRWNQRVNQLLEKTARVDPDEHEEIKSKLARAEAAAAEATKKAESQLQTFQGQRVILEKRIASTQASMAAWKKNAKELDATNETNKTALAAAQAEINVLKSSGVSDASSAAQEIKTLKKELEKSTNNTKRFKDMLQQLKPKLQLGRETLEKQKAEFESGRKEVDLRHAMVVQRLQARITVLEQSVAAAAHKDASAPPPSTGGVGTGLGIGAKRKRVDDDADEGGRAAPPVRPAPAPAPAPAEGEEAQTPEAEAVVGGAASGADAEAGVAEAGAPEEAGGAGGGVDAGEDGGAAAEEPEDTPAAAMETEEGTRTPVYEAGERARTPVYEAAAEGGAETTADATPDAVPAEGSSFIELQTPSSNAQPTSSTFGRGGVTLPVPAEQSGERTPFGTWLQRTGSQGRQQGSNSSPWVAIPAETEELGGENVVPTPSTQTVPTTPNRDSFAHHTGNPFVPTTTLAGEDNEVPLSVPAATPTAAATLPQAPASPVPMETEEEGGNEDMEDEAPSAAEASPAAPTVTAQHVPETIEDRREGKGNGVDQPEQVLPTVEETSTISRRATADLSGGQSAAPSSPTKSGKKTKINRIVFQKKADAPAPAAPEAGKAPEKRPPLVKGVPPKLAAPTLKSKVATPNPTIVVTAAAPPATPTDDDASSANAAGQGQGTEEDNGSTEENGDGEV